MTENADRRLVGSGKRDRKLNSDNLINSVLHSLRVTNNNRSNTRIKYQILNTDDDEIYDFTFICGAHLCTVPAHSNEANQNEC